MDEYFHKCVHCCSNPSLYRPHSLPIEKKVHCRLTLLLKMIYFCTILYMESFFWLSGLIKCFNESLCRVPTSQGLSQIWPNLSISIKVFWITSIGKNKKKLFLNLKPNLHKLTIFLFLKFLQFFMTYGTNLSIFWAKFFVA